MPLVLVTLLPKAGGPDMEDRETTYYCEGRQGDRVLLSMEMTDGGCTEQQLFSSDPKMQPHFPSAWESPRLWGAS